jgi:transcriptional regulator GlxA family with amidase domain
MAERYDRNISLEDVARFAGVSLRSLHYAFQRELQRTPGQHLLRLRLNRAKELVEAGTEKIGSIAVSCGFLTPRNFHRAFIKEFGLPPVAYRNRHREKVEEQES